MLLLASGATLWWNWGPWELDFSLQREKILSWGFNERWLGVITLAPGSDVNRTTLTLYDLNTGREGLQEISAHLPWPATELNFS